MRSVGSTSSARPAAWAANVPGEITAVALPGLPGSVTPAATVITALPSSATACVYVPPKVIVDVSLGNTTSAPSGSSPAAVPPAIAYACLPSSWTPRSNIVAPTRFARSTDDSTGGVASALVS